MTAATANDEDAARDTAPAPTSPHRRPIRLTLPEVRRLFTLSHQGKRLIHRALQWSSWRRHHQGDARWHHYRRRLKIQALAL